jgi:hypothetical protein
MSGGLSFDNETDIEDKCFIYDTKTKNIEMI